jgi:hypothetical protein
LRKIVNFWRSAVVHHPPSEIESALSRMDRQPWSFHQQPTTREREPTPSSNQPAKNIKVVGEK